jgi:dihydroorotate dehydrogenase electron transfer subunit
MTKQLASNPFSKRYEIIRHSQLTEAVWQLVLAYDQKAEPGQFVNLYLDEADLLLPRPISVCRQEEGKLTLVYAIRGEGTRRLARREPGQALRVSQPLGKGYETDYLQKGQTALLIGGGLGIPPLLHLAETLAAREIGLTTALGYRDDSFLLEEFQKTGAEVNFIVEPPFSFAERFDPPSSATASSEPGTDFAAVLREMSAEKEAPRGQVTDLLAGRQWEVDACFACGPKAMLQKVTAQLAEMGKPVQVSLEERMGCGYGACVGCVCRVLDPKGRAISRKVCVDGPVFWGSEVIWNA